MPGKVIDKSALARSGEPHDSYHNILMPAQKVFR